MMKHPLAALFLGLSLTGVQAQRVIHVLVALCDNEHQGIVPVPKVLGNGKDLDRNLYWGAAYGVRTWFDRSNEWERVSRINAPKAHVLERLIWKHRTENIYLVADGYEGEFIRDAVKDLMSYTTGAEGSDLTVGAAKLGIGGRADLLGYCGHDALMEYSLPAEEGPVTWKAHEVIVLACASKAFFSSPLKERGATPLLWTTGLMCPEAYTLDAALQGWVRDETAAQMRERAAQAYAKWQKCGVSSARKLLVTGW